MGKYWPKIFYTLHSSLSFIAPLLYMIITQTQIRRVLRSRVQTINNTLMEREFNRRHKKVATTLVALTTAFVICWSPFMVTRTLLYYHLASYDLIWTGSQLLVCLNAAVGSFGRFPFSQNFRNFRFGGKWNTFRRFVPLENSQKKWKI